MIENGLDPAESSVEGVPVLHWNPHYRLVIGGKTVTSLPKRINNFGDLLGPALAEQIVRSAGLVRPPRTPTSRLLTVGSIMHFAHTGDVVWGTGVNGKIPRSRILFEDLDVRAVRGPRTAQYLNGFGIDADVPFGDPGLLLPELLPDLRELATRKRYRRTLVPNLNDLPKYRRHPDLLDPRGSLETRLARIVQSESVTGSSLHAMIVAESFGVPFVPLTSEHESPFKFHDYVEGTGRELPTMASNPDAANRSLEPLAFDPRALLDAFPRDLWGAS